jgi:N-acetylglucosamine kinase-like BadF-type ATPase
MPEVAIGVDIGGTSSRALAVTSDGAVFGRGGSGGGNPNSHPPEVAAGRVADAVAAALGAGGDVLACLLGVAGESKFTDPAVVEVFETALRRVGVGCAVTVVSDAEVAFASATREPAGTVIIGGTGSVAARIVDRRKTTWCGGWGWLLGDEGSAYWIGREAVRTTLRALQSDLPVGSLGIAVLATAVDSPDLELDERAGRRTALSMLITAANAAPPIQLAGFATLVSEHSAMDPAATSIVDRAAELLAAHATAVRTPGERTPIVLAGSVVGPDSPVGVAVRDQLRDEGEVLFAPDGTLGAAWLAALLAWGDTSPRPAPSGSGVA